MSSIESKQHTIIEQETEQKKTKEGYFGLLFTIAITSV